MNSRLKPGLKSCVESTFLRLVAERGGMRGAGKVTYLASRLQRSYYYLLRANEGNFTGG